MGRKAENTNKPPEGTTDPVVSPVGEVETDAPSGAPESTTPTAPSEEAEKTPPPPPPESDPAKTLPKFRANWRIDGLFDESVEPGKVFELPEEVAAPLVENGTMSLVEEGDA